MWLHSRSRVRLTTSVLFVLLVCLASLRITVADERLHRRSAVGSRQVPATHSDLDGTEYAGSREHVSASVTAVGSTDYSEPVSDKRSASRNPTSRRLSQLPSLDRSPIGREAEQLDSQLLHELDRLIDLHQQKVDVLLRMRHGLSHPADTSLPHSSADVISAQSVVESTLSAADSPVVPPAASQPRHSKQRASSGSGSDGGSESFSLSSAIPQLAQRAAVFLAAIAVLVVWQYVQHKRSQRPSTSTSAAWEDEWMARRRRREALQRPVKTDGAAGLRRRRVVAAAVGGGEQCYEEEGKELHVESEEYEQRDGSDWDEAAGDYYDASGSRHDGYVGVFGVEDDEKEGLEDELDVTSGTGMLMEDDDDDDELEEEEEEDEQLPDDDEQG